MKGCEFMNLNGGYAMIKFNSTQEELAVAYKSKRPALFYDENQRAHWAVIEETATESVDEETQEPITIYKYSYRLLDEASEVVANPTLSGDEDTLNGIDIDGTKYKVGGSGSEVHLYRHVLKLFNNDYYVFGIVEILNVNNTPFTRELLFNKLKSNGQQYQYAVSAFRFGSSVTVSFEMSILGFDSANNAYLITSLNYNKLTNGKPEYFSFTLGINSLLVQSDDIEQIF